MTGAEGLIGSIVRRELAERYEIRALTRTAQPFPSHVADIADFDAIRPAFEGVEAVVHLAASPAVGTPWPDVLRNNIVGTYHVFEAARQAGADRLVFASSNHVVGMYEVEAAPALYTMSAPPIVDARAELRPDSLYGVSKAFGEALARYYVERHGLRAVCLRIGSVRPDDDPTAESRLEVEPWRTMSPAERRARQAATWLSQRDCAELIRCALDADVRWAVVYGVSDNPTRFWDLDGARETIGFVPRDRAPDPREPPGSRG